MDQGRLSRVLAGSIPHSGFEIQYAGDEQAGAALDQPQPPVPRPSAQPRSTSVNRPNLPDARVKRSCLSCGAVSAIKTAQSGPGGEVTAHAMHTTSGRRHRTTQTGVRSARNGRSTTGDAALAAVPGRPRRACASSLPAGQTGYYRPPHRPPGRRRWPRPSAPLLRPCRRPADAPAAWGLHPVQAVVGQGQRGEEGGAYCRWVDRRAYVMEECWQSQGGEPGTPLQPCTSPPRPAPNVPSARWPMPADRPLGPAPTTSASDLPVCGTGL